MAMTKKGASDAAITRLQLAALDRALSEIVLRSECLSLRGKDQLAAMKRKLRSMRIEVEVEYRLPDLGKASQVLPPDFPSAGNSHPDHVNTVNIRGSLNKSGALTNGGVTGEQASSVIRGPWRSSPDRPSPGRDGPG